MAERPVKLKQSKRPESIEARTYRFALRIIKLVRALPRDVARSVHGRQVLRGGTSTGASCEEAIAAQSRADFISRKTIALEEARETLYWLRLIRDSELVRPSRLSSLVTESDEIVCILAS